MNHLFDIYDFKKHDQNYTTLEKAIATENILIEMYKQNSGNIKINKQEKIQDTEIDNTPEKQGKK